MKTYNDPSRPARGGFKRIELIVVVAVVAILGLLAIVAPGRLKENALRSHCRANLTQIYKALSLYAADNHNLLPDCRRDNPAFSGPFWAWDMNTNLTEDLLRRGATREAFYCPANPLMNDNDHWDFWNVHHTPVRIMGYGFLLPGVGIIPQWLWCPGLKGNNNGMPPAQAQLMVDAVISQKGNYAQVVGVLKDRSNHLNGTSPLGGNIAYDDGHAEWKDFKDMQHRFADGTKVVWDY